MILYLQKNIIRQDYEELENICKKNDIKMVSFFHIPFSDNYPELDFKDIFFVYGASSVTDKIYETYQNEFAGVFAHSSNINIKNLFETSKDLMWSKPIFIGKIKDSLKIDRDSFFVRPIIDNKWMSGNVFSNYEYKEWIEKLEKIDFDLNTEICMCEVNYPQQEYRLFVVNEEIVTSSIYRQNMELYTEEGCPLIVKNFALKFIKENQKQLPCSYVLDIGVDNKKIGVIEVNNINNSGFYKINKEKLILSIQNYLEKQYLFNKNIV